MPITEPGEHATCNNCGREYGDHIRLTQAVLREQRDDCGHNLQISLAYALVGAICPTNMFLPEPGPK